MKQIPDEFLSCLRTAQSLSLHILTRESKIPVSVLANSAPSSSMKIECTPRHLLAFIRCAHLCVGGNSSFTFTRTGVPPLILFPIKSKHDMERKIQKFPIYRELLRELDRRIPLLTRIDAHVCLRQFAVIGLFHRPIIDACIDRIMMGLAITPHQQCVDVILHLGVLGYRHVACREIVDAINTKLIGEAGLRKLLRGMAMLQIPWKNSEEIKEIHNHVWMFALRPSGNSVTDLGWHIDVIHALVTLNAIHYRFLLRTCRQVRNEMKGFMGEKQKQQQFFERKMAMQNGGGQPPSPSLPIPPNVGRPRGGIKKVLSAQQHAQLLWTIGKVDRKSVPEDLDRDWKQIVNRVRKMLIQDAMEQASQMISVVHEENEEFKHPPEYYQQLHNTSSAINIVHHSASANNTNLPLLFQALESVGIHATDVIEYAQKKDKDKVWKVEGENSESS
jgi:hypothetical protein